MTRDGSRGTASSAEPERLLEVTDLQLRLNSPRGPVYAVDGLTLTLDRGVTLGLVGESGSGKSMTCKAIMGLISDRRGTITGSVRYDGTDLTRLPLERRKELWGTELAMVNQDAGTALNPVLSVGCQLTEGLRWHLKLSKREARDRAIELLTHVGIPEPKRRLGQYPHELSGGMRQRVNIAIALSCGPSLLLADEPTTALDVTVQAQILDLLADLQDEHRMTMILVSHDLGVVAGRTDFTAVMYGGRIVEIAPTKDLFAAPRMPYTRALLASMPRLTAPSHTRLRATPGAPPDLTKRVPGCRFAPRCAFARDRCRSEEPPLVDETGSGHLFSCWYPDSGTPEETGATLATSGQTLKEDA
ncbi:ATP-binding cassette domain-containing protein [Actinomadura sp. LD22]|uniref:ATP-binding cassette domain-containing protein n=1 Tax=Actinomadura physcomitrii TaxID=2650748 RepID=A0A6I4MPT1_9ACTN|nr:ABC transporter ATP-binding protein [Actinomadura physcomitrii]MWA04819.1 ATP-binding cassette domain-containing protein [Actinomadura physcomitrii]